MTENLHFLARILFLCLDEKLFCSVDFEISFLSRPNMIFALYRKWCESQNVELWQRSLEMNVRYFFYVRHLQFTHPPNWFGSSFIATYIHLSLSSIDYIILRLQKSAVQKASIAIRFIESNVIHMKYSICVKYPTV